ncbi:MAG: hypothetical protein M5U15_05000 [Kiritimatiellae bacterium]|nr:hypothetical protein [Kiritimatiellia bacterium]
MKKRAAARILAGGLVAVALTVLAGCATQALNTARREFYQGRFGDANTTLERKIPKKDRVLFLMERGTIRLFGGEYEQSARDYIEANDRLVELETYSLSKGGASLVVNDSVQDFRGFPYERTLLHAFTAKNHLALGHWENAAVEARRLIESLTPEKRGDYPDDAYSHYFAGFALELIGDTSNARLQYQKAAELAPDVNINPDTGRFGKGNTASPENELVVFVLMGKAPRTDNISLSNLGRYAEIYAGDKLLGRSYEFTDVADLCSTSFQKDAARQVTKTIARIAAKEALAQQIEKDNEMLGELTRFVLIGLLEHPDYRRWETLPRYLQVARVPCPPDLSEYTVVFKNRTGAELSRRTVATPLAKQGSTFVSFTRDIVEAAVFR